MTAEGGRHGGAWAVLPRCWLWGAGLLQKSDCSNQETLQKEAVKMLFLKPKHQPQEYNVVSRSRLSPTQCAFPAGAPVVAATPVFIAKEQFHLQESESDTCPWEGRTKHHGIIWAEGASGQALLKAGSALSLPQSSPQLPRGLPIPSGKPPPLLHYPLVFPLLFSPDPLISS